MHKFDGIGLSAIKYAIMNFVLIVSNLFLMAMGPHGGGTGDREEGLGFYYAHWIVLVIVFLLYGSNSIISGRKTKKVRLLTSMPLLLSVIFIISLMGFSLSKYEEMYEDRPEDRPFFNDVGQMVLDTHSISLTYLVYSFIVFAVLISIVGLLGRVRYSILALLLNLSTLLLHVHVIEIASS